MDKNGDSEVDLEYYGEYKPDKKFSICETFPEKLKTGKIDFFVWATDEKHAVKIANERRTQFLASNKWPIREVE